MLLSRLLIPLKIMEHALLSMKLIESLSICGNPNSVSDAGVAALCARSAVLGGYLNVMINAKDYTNQKEKDKLISKAETMKKRAMKKEAQILKITLKTIKKSV